ncbi:MAG: hypothetical protein PHR68_00125 [Candidatus Gracilibacteria bacterium]|nr:hypothetical protein [Candidatus Gracilibacteria bacterium]
MKKIVLIFFFLLSFGIGNVFAVNVDISLTDSVFGTNNSPTTSPVTNNNPYRPTVKNANNSSPRLDTTNSTEDTSLYGVDTSGFSSNQGNSSSTTTSCAGGKESLCSADFEIDTSLFSPGGNNFKNKSTSKKTIDGFLTTLIQKLMIALGSISLFVMIIGSGFMIFAMGKDDNLNKGKTIFKAGIIALVIALSSYMMVSLLKYILYANN